MDGPKGNYRIVRLVLQPYPAIRQWLSDTPSCRICKKSPNYYIFIAKDANEFFRYPCGGYEANLNSRVLYKSKRISARETVVVLGSFGEKEELSQTINDDSVLRFVTTVSALVRKFDCPVQKHSCVTVFIHFGNVDIGRAEEFAKKCEGVWRAFRDKKVVDKNDEELVEVYNFVHENVLNEFRFHAISSTDSSLIDLTMPKIQLPENENEMAEFIKRFDGAEGVRGKIRECFKKKWECDSVRTASDCVVDDADYIAKCKELGFVAKEVS